MANFDEYAAYYDLLYRDKDYAGEAGFIHELVTEYAPQAKSLLELGCGTGLHAQLLAEKGYSIHGVDISPTMIARAGQRLLETDSRSRLSFEEADIRTVRVGRKFDGAISLFHVISYQTSNEDVLAAFRSAAGHLEEGGIFIFDIWYGPAVLTQRPEVRIKRMNSAAHHVVRISEPTLDPNNCICDVDFTVFVSTTDGVETKVVSERHRMRYFFLPELKFLLDAAGFQLEASFEWITRNRPASDTWGVCILARK